MCFARTATAIDDDETTPYFANPAQDIL